MTNAIYNQLLARANSLTQNADLAQDLVQDTLLKFYETYEDFDGTPEEQHKLLNTILTNTNIDSHRKKREVVFSDLETEDQESGETITFEPAGGIMDINYEDVETLVNGLKPKLREAANLILIKGLSYADTADALGLTMSALHSRIYKVRKIFQKELGD